jgi:hypothetical protein
MNNPTRESPGSQYEIQNLRSRGVQVEAITDSKVGQGLLKVDGQTYDLNEDPGRNNFVASLRLPPDQAAKVAAVIESASSNARDEVAGIARVWARAERGQPVPSRVVMGGHHVGSGVWGDGNGTIPWELLQGLAEAMPRAAAQVEDLHVAACYSGGAHLEAQYVKIFPNLRTSWGYTGSAPGPGSGATIHQAAWEQATRGRGTGVAAAAERLKQQGVRKAEYISARAMDEASRASVIAFDAAMQTVRSGEYSLFQEFFEGRREVANSQTGPLRDFYNAVQRVLESPNLDQQTRQGMEELRDRTIRLLFYNSHVRVKFAEVYAREIAAGYQAVGLPPPNFAALPRAQAIQAMRDFRERTSGRSESPEVDALSRCLYGLYNLDPAVIRQEWI